ncbi:hypothetical protein ILUMI_14004 [Ignelater luminosus]|uniref:Uncharacterized protein n=1 Tax=Ignelater luminosus TaxID=2038154 RepID=A0A8K0G597_IGNLU|nr:hypothetical protein ILUMI_14004 [Ignelater luminosus]
MRILMLDPNISDTDTSLNTTTTQHNNVANSLDVNSQVMTMERSEVKNGDINHHIPTIVMPAVTKKRGCPAGTDVTVTGLKKKKGCMRPLPFDKKSSNEKISLMM